MIGAFQEDEEGKGFKGKRGESYTDPSTLTPLILEDSGRSWCQLMHGSATPGQALSPERLVWVVTVLPHAEDDKLCYKNCP